MLFNFLRLLAETTAEEPNNCGTLSTVIMIVVIVLIFGVTIVLPMFTGKKKQKEANEMLETLSVGDEIMTAGGVMGTIVELKTHESGEKLMVVETGKEGEKTTMTFTLQAMRFNYTKMKQRQEMLAKQKAEKEAAKQANGKKDVGVAEQQPSDEAERSESENETENKDENKENK